MSLPGLELSQQTIEAQRAPPQPTQISLSKGSEWRFEVAFGNTTRVKLLAGTAEIFGTELAVSQTYTFSGTKAAIYTWHGCTLEVSAGEPVAIGPIGSAPVPPGPANGGCQVEYIAEETPMAEYANVHFALETMRQEAARVGAGKEGPRVLILGPEDAGKTSLTKTLTGYATKMGRQPLVVNLDPAEGMLSVPGALTATAMRSMIDVEEGWGSSPMSGPSPIPVKLPLVYFYGLPSPLDGEGSYYKAVVSRLALAVTGRMAEDQDAREAGVIVDTPGIIGLGKGASEDIIHHIVTEFSISTILIIGSERLYSTMVKSYDNKPVATSATAAAVSSDRISVVKLTKSGGCVDRDATFMKHVRESQIRSYFFGTYVPSTASSALSSSSTATGTTITLSPHTSQVDFDSLCIYSITTPTDGEEDEYDPSHYESFLPGGSTDLDTTTSSSLQPSSSLLPGLSSTSEFTSPTNPSQPSSTSSTPLKKLPSPATLALENTLLAITHAAPNASLTEIRDASIMGFVYVADVEEKKGLGQGGKMRLLAPVGGRVPKRAMIWGRKWPGEMVGLIG